MALSYETQELLLTVAFWGMLAVLIAGVPLFLVWLARVPGKIARERNHPNAEAINVCAWIGLLCGGVFWLVALIWAHTKPRTAGPDRLVDRPARPSPSVPTSDDRAGYFRVSGVDRATRMDVSEYIAADSTANARVKAELKGILVTSVTRPDLR